MAAAAAIEEADRELAEMAGSGMDESGLRRELEAAGQAVQTPRLHAARSAKLEELQLEATGLEVRREEAQPSPRNRARARRGDRRGCDPALDASRPFRSTARSTRARRALAPGLA